MLWSLRQSRSQKYFGYSPGRTWGVLRLGAEAGASSPDCPAQRSVRPPPDKLPRLCCCCSSGGAGRGAAPPRCAQGQRAPGHGGGVGLQPGGGRGGAGWGAPQGYGTRTNPPPHTHPRSRPLPTPAPASSPWAGGAGRRVVLGNQGAAPGASRCGAARCGAVRCGAVRCGAAGGGAEVVFPGPMRASIGLEASDCPRDAVTRLRVECKNGSSPRSSSH
ncbi:POU domain, class 4, transcription factor 1-like [Myiozetetes cayanensis]|uniref:POU domain, class 4, transcription factor 1-like n=1 Tax=Myiozetetes cayanensis TaxID=478635 RepID=UPI0021608D82|nr:POU domain, class 4, transcription factor 1-like [Myiozetetes cayanensis]